MLINFWYVAEWSKSVKDKPVKVELLGLKFVLFRDESGKVRCLSDVCIHRSGSLGCGWTTNGNITCPYHGWQFNGEGKTVFIPSEGEDFKIPDKARVDSYPTEERYGMIWVFLGDLPESERPAIPDFPEYDDPKWRRITTEWTWNADASRVLENGLDIAHASFVHPTFGRQDTAKHNEIVNVERGEFWGRSENIQYPPKMTGNPIRRMARKEKQPTTTRPEYNLSGHLARIQVEINSRMSLLMFDCNTPVNENTTRTFVTQLRSFLKSPIFDSSSKKRLHGIIKEDVAIVEAIEPVTLPTNLSHEVSVRDDKFMSSFRLARRKCIEEKGWKIDVAQMREKLKTQALAIPSPARRENPDIDWPIETVPLVPAVRKPVKTDTD